MLIESYKTPRSSFLSLEKDMQIICDLILKNKNLKKLLYYTTRDALSKPNLTEDQSLELFEKSITTVPSLTIVPEVLNYLVITFDDFGPNQTNPEFRDNLIHFDIVCHYDQWKLQDFQLRPFRIAAEIDTALNNQRLTGIGKVEFVGGSRFKVDDEFGGLTLFFRTVHGEEDKKTMPNPMDQQKFVTDFDELYNG